jgi:uncharacterized protein
MMGSARGILGVRALVTIAALFTSLLITLAHALDFPVLTGRVVDEANIIDTRTREDLNRKLAALEGKSSDQLVVVTLKSLQGTSIEDFGYQLGRHWQIGQAGKNNGVLLIVAPNDRKVRIEVGRGLEGTLTDAISRLIIENAIVPRFRANDYAGGIVRAVDDIIDVLTGDPEEWKRRAAKRPESSGWVATFAAIMLFLVVIAVPVAIFGGFFVLLTGAARRGGRSKRHGSGWLWATPDHAPYSSGSSGGFSGGGGGGGGDSGGGFSGGGGDFGGGGASGSW